MKFCKQEIFDKIDTYIAENKERILKDLLDLIRIPSVQGEPKQGMPFGEACGKMLEETTALYERHGFNGRIDPDGYYAVSFYGEEGAKTIGLFSHGDVVPADGEWLICPPFEPIIKDGYVFGRGCNDDKSGILETVYAAEIIRDMNFDLKSRLLMFTGANEETGMKDIEAYVKCEEMPDASFVVDGEYPCYCGERGTLRFRLIGKNRFDTIKKISGGKASNVILGEVTAEITYEEALWQQIKRACENNDSFVLTKDENTVTVTAKGISSHMMHSEKSLNACKVLADMLTGCDSLSENDKRILADMRALVNDAYGTAFGIVHNDEIFGKLVCGNGIIKTVDGVLDMYFDIRAGLSYDLDDMREQILSAVKNTWEYREERCQEGYYLAEDAPLRVLVENTYRAVSGILDAEGIRTAAGTHAKRLNNALPIGTVGYYKAKPIDLPNGHGGVHQPDEKLNIDGFFEAIKILVCMIMELDAELNS